MAQVPLSAVDLTSNGLSEPRVFRRHVTGSESARGLLFTIMGEFVLPAAGPAWTSTFIEVLGRLGVEPKTTRQALMRASGDGWLRAERVGRRTRWTLTPNAEQLLIDGAKRIYGFRASQHDWDGQWLLVMARAPEMDRSARHHLRTRLQWAGCGDPAPGVWVSTHVSRRPEVEGAIASAGLARDAQIFTARHDVGSLGLLVDQAWDVPALERGYEQFLEDFALSGSPAQGPDDGALVAVIELVHTWRRFPWVDPMLPDELLPADWSGNRAARLFAETHAKWSAAARTAWKGLNEGGS